MNYLNKFLKIVKENPTIFKSEDAILKFGLTNTHIKELKKYALDDEILNRFVQIKNAKKKQLADYIAKRNY